MSELPKISVVVATRNRAGYLRRMLNKLFEDDYPNLEVIVVDGASTDNTVALLESYAGKITRWISEPDDGEYFALNKGLAMATGGIIKFMSDDDILRHGVFSFAARYFSARPEVDIVFGQTACWKEKRWGSTPMAEHHMMDCSRLTLHHWLRETQGVSSLSSFIRRGVFARIGPLSTEYACGDVEFWARAASNGIKMGLMPDVVIDYHYTGGNGVITRRWRIAADMVWINAKYGTKLDVLMCIWRKFLVLAQLGKVCDLIHFHPRQAWRGWREHFARGS